MPKDACLINVARIDVWLWRARLFKTRTQAAAAVEHGRIRLARTDGSHSRVDKASRTVRPGDSLVFVHAGRLLAIRVRAAGERRGPAAEARALYETLDGNPAPTIDNSGSGLTNTPAPAGAPSSSPLPPSPRVKR